MLVLLRVDKGSPTLFVSLKDGQECAVLRYAMVNTYRHSLPPRVQSYLQPIVADSIYVNACKERLAACRDMVLRDCLQEKLTLQKPEELPKLLSHLIT
jgi:hypothetical protein